MNPPPPVEMEERSIDTGFQVSDPVLALLQARPCQIKAAVGEGRL